MKISRLNIAATRAEKLIDAHFSLLISNESGSLSQLHMMKRLLAVNGIESPLVPDREAVLQRAGEQDQRIAELDAERRSLKAVVRAARTSSEIAGLVAHLDVHALRNQFTD